MHHTLARTGLSILVMSGLVTVGCSVNDAGLGAAGGKGMGSSVDAASSTSFVMDPTGGLGPALGTGSGGLPTVATSVGSGGQAAGGEGVVSSPPGGGGSSLGVGTGGVANAGGGSAAGDGAPAGGTTAALGGMGGEPAGRGAIGSGGLGAAISAGGAPGGGGRGMGAEGGAGGAARGGSSGAAIGTGGTTGGSDGRGGRGALGTGGANQGGCDATSCPDGCCNLGRCVNNRNDSHCGTAGQACVACDSCYQCSDVGACVPDPQARWQLSCSSAKIASTKPNGQPWDAAVFGASGAPDPYCRISNDGQIVSQTTTQTDTFTPMWDRSQGGPGRGGPGPGGPGQGGPGPGGPGPSGPGPGGPGQGGPSGGGTIAASDLLTASGRVEITVIDEDGLFFSTDTICAFVPELVSDDLQAGTATFPPVQSCQSLTIQLTCAQ